MSEENFSTTMDPEHMEIGFKILDLMKGKRNRTKLEILGFVFLLAWETIAVHHPKDSKEIRKACKKYFKSISLLCLETMGEANE